MCGGGGGGGEVCWKRKRKSVIMEGIKVVAESCKIKKCFSLCACTQAEPCTRADREDQVDRHVLCLGRTNEKNMKSSKSADLNEPFHKHADL